MKNSQFPGVPMDRTDVPIDYSPLDPEECDKLYRHFPQMVVLRSITDGRLIYCNRSSENLLITRIQSTSFESREGNSWNRDQGLSTLDRLFDDVKTDGTALPSEICFSGNAHPDEYFHVTAFPVLQNGQVVAVGYVFQDLTGYKKLQNEYAELENTIHTMRAYYERMLDLVAHLLSHNIKNYISSAGMYFYLRGQKMPGITAKISELVMALIEKNSPSNGISDASTAVNHISPVQPLESDPDQSVLPALDIVNNLETEVTKPLQSLDKFSTVAENCLWKVSTLLDRLHLYRNLHVPAFQAVDLRAVISTWMTGLVDAGLLKKKNIGFSLIFDPSVPDKIEVPVLGDSLKIVLEELYKNSLQALDEWDGKNRGSQLSKSKDMGVSQWQDSMGLSSFSKRIELQISIDQGSCRLCWSDTGGGILPEDLPHVKKPFFTKRETVGPLGLGLSIVEQIVQKHNGVLEIASRPGESTTVTIRLPLSF